MLIIFGIPVCLTVLIRFLQLAGVPYTIRVPLIWLSLVFVLVLTVAWFYRTDNKALRESEARYRQLFESNPHPMWVYDIGNLRFLAVNDAAVQQYGYTREQFLAMTIRDIRPPQDQKALDENLARAPEALEQSSSWRHLKKDGSVIEVDVTSHDIVFDGKPGRLVLANNITERNKIEAQLLRAQRMESIGTLAGGIAHDLNNVLAPIMMGMELLRENVQTNSALSLIDAMETSAKRGAGIVRQVLTFARGIEGDRIPIQPKHLIMNIARLIGQTFPKSISLQTDMPRDLWTVVGDATQLDQVLLNLCVNARDAMPDGGRLSINAKNEILDEHYTRLNLEAKAGPYVIIEVTDTGQGIAPGHLEKIFEPFFTTKEIGKGTGLGLSTARAIARSHGGFLTVYSDIGKGTSFKLYLPAKQSAVTVQARSSAGNLPLGRGELILVVDDEAAVRDISRFTLESHNYRVITASDGAQALGFYAEHKDSARVVLLDMMMPIMDGHATIRALESLNPTVKIIAASGLMNKQAQIGHSAEMSAAVKAVLGKPFTAETLLNTLHRVLNA
jgi:two-component system, cell cycle sensor histidine kinase and response regulator CckA